MPAEPSDDADEVLSEATDAPMIPDDDALSGDDAPAILGHAASAHSGEDAPSPSGYSVLAIPGNDYPVTSDFNALAILVHGAPLSELIYTSNETR